MNARRSYKLFSNGGRSPQSPPTSTSNSRAPTFHPPTNQNLPASPTSQIPPTPHKTQMEAMHRAPDSPTAQIQIEMLLCQMTQLLAMVEVQAETMQTKELMVIVVQTLAVVEGETKALLCLDQTTKTQPTSPQMTTKSALSLLSRLVLFTLRCLRDTPRGHALKKPTHFGRPAASG